MAGVSVSRARVEMVAELLLRPYAQVIFSRRLLSGTLVFAAIALFPRLAVATVGSVLLAHAVTLLLGLGLPAARDGAIACGALLAALAAAYSVDGASTALIVTAALLAVLYGAALTSLFSRAALPVHSIPFVLAAWTATLIARGMPGVSSGAVDSWSALPAAFTGSGPLDVAAAILFLHGAAAGALVLAAIAWHSRIALLLAGVGVAAAWLVRIALHGDAGWTPADLVAAFNAILAAMALGGVWFVASGASIALAATGAAVACAVTYAMIALLAPIGLSALSLPFAIATLLGICALRLRERDRWPASAPAADSPEEALTRHLMRIRRFGESAWLPFRLPFRGTWVVTQAHDGAHTHQGAWRHAFDFEASGAGGARFEGDGGQLAQYACYGLPVLAAGTGTVEHVIDGVPDNAVGALNTRNNWGNAVVIAHGANLYSVCAHLQPRSIRVKPGDLVRAGTEIGRCGNSGRSEVPHLHFHVQRGPALGNETIAADFGDVVSRVDGRALVGDRSIPSLGDIVRPVVRDEALAQALAFTPGSTWRLSQPETGREEVARVEVDLLGRRLLRSAVAQLYVESYDAALVVVACDGARDSLMRFVLLALARVPFDQEGQLAWSDRVPHGLGGSHGLDFTGLFAVIAPRLAADEMRYASRRTEAALVIVGTSAAFTTRATISLAGGAHVIEYANGERRTVLHLEPVAAVTAEAPK